MSNHKQATSLFLIGMMATGKSTVGKQLAEKLGWEFFDVDREVEKRTGASVALIFEKEGERGFRCRETQIMAELTARNAVVVAMGGGAPMFEINRKLLARGLVIQLTATVSDVIERTRLDQSRPLLQTQDRVRRIRDLLLERGPTYDAVSQVKVSTSRVSPAALVERLLAVDAVADAVDRGNRERHNTKQTKEDIL